MDKPILSPDFTIDDLYKLREYNSSRHINMSTDEINKDLHDSVEEFNKRIAELKKENQLVTH